MREFPRRRRPSRDEADFSSRISRDETRRRNANATPPRRPRSWQHGQLCELTDGLGLKKDAARRVVVARVQTNFPCVPLSSSVTEGDPFLRILGGKEATLISVGDIINAVSAKNYACDKVYSFIHTNTYIHIQSVDDGAAPYDTPQHY